MKKILCMALVLLGVVASASAQTNLVQTTLSAAISATATQVVVASATGIASPTPISGNVMAFPIQTELVIDGEAMLVTGINGTSVNVVRGSNSTMATAHAANSVVWIASPNQLYTIAPAGACTAANTVNPYINVQTGQYWFCDSGTGNWQNVFSTGAITPVATAASIQTAAQTFTVHGLATGEPIVVVSQPAPTSLCPLVAARVTAANTVSLYWTTLTAAACTPAAGTYFLLAPRLNIP